MPGLDSFHVWRRDKGENKHELPKDVTYDDNYHHVVSSMQNFNAIVDSKGRLQFVSHNVLVDLGYGQEETLGKSFWEVSWLDDSLKVRNEGEDFIKKALAGKSAQWETQAFAKDGTALPVVFSASSLAGTSGNIVSVVATTLQSAKVIEDTHQPELEAISYSSIVDVVKQVYFSTDQSGMFRSISPLAAQMLGYDSSNDLLDKYIENIWAHPEEQSEFLRRLTTRGWVKNYHATFLTKEDAHIVVDVDACLLYDAEGEDLGIEAVFRDVTQRTTNKQWLKEVYMDLAGSQGVDEGEIKSLANSDQQYLSLLQNASDGIILIQDGIIEFANGAMERLLGYDTSELNSMSFETIISPHGLEGAWEGHERRIKSDVLGETEEIGLLTQDSEVVVVNISSVTLQYGGKPAVLSIVRGICNRQGGVQAQGQHHELSSLIMDNANDGVVLLDQDFNLLYVSDKSYEMLGYTPEDVNIAIDLEGGSNQFVVSLISASDPDVVKEVLSKLSRHFAGEELPQLMELRMLCKNGTVFPVELSSRIVEYRGKLADLIFVRDISERKQAEDALQEANIRYQTIFNNRLNMVFVNDLQSRFIDTNSAPLELTGYTLEELKNLSYSDIIVPEDLPKAFGALSSVASGNSMTPIDIRIKGKSGEIFWITTIVLPLEHNGEVYAVMSIAQDITERKRVEGEVRESENKFRIILENMQDAYFRTDISGNVVMGNSRAVEMSGLSSIDGLLGRNIAEWMSSEQIPVFMNALTETGHVRGFESNVIRPNGDWLPIEFNAQLIYGADGNHPAGFEGTARDISDRRQSEQALQDSEERFRTLIENASDAIAILSSDGIIQYESPSVERLLGYCAEELVGTNGLDLIHPDDLPDIMSRMSSFIDYPGMTESMEIRYKHKNGSWCWFEMVGQNLLHNSKVQGLVINYRGIDERKRTQDELLASEQKLKALVGKLKLSQEELSTPVVQIWDHILALPLIGVIDPARAQQITEVLLSRVVETHTELVILDVTGVACIDTAVANCLISTIQATNLLGAECVITGIKPEVAQSMIHLGLDINTIVTKRDLQDGLLWGMQKIGYRVSRQRR